MLFPLQSLTIHFNSTAHFTEPHRTESTSCILLLHLRCTKKMHVAAVSVYTVYSQCSITRVNVPNQRAEREAAACRAGK
jgi:hypothetical protein